MEDFVMSFESDFDGKFGNDPEFGGSSGIDAMKLVVGGLAVVGVLAIGSMMFSSGGDDAEAVAEAPPAVPMYLQAQQAAIEAMRSQQELMMEMQKQRMAEAEGYYEDAYGGDDGW